MQADNVDVRECTPADAGRLGEPYAASWAGHLAGRWDFLTAWSGEQLVASAQLRWEGPHNADVAQARPGQVELGFLQVAEGWRGQGIGAAVVRLAESRCRDRHVTSLGLGVAMDNHQALDLYLRLGYADTGLRFTDRYTWTDADGVAHDAAEPGMYLVRERGAGAVP
ncbi:MAG: putative acetyltransferase [Frankiales bacterium]|nr:putative acetyltransferase [Frankiales bacterium]